MNNNDLLNITMPDLVYRIHKDYAAAGADIIETNTFNGTSIAQDDFKTSEHAFEINIMAARMARRAADEVAQLQNRPVFVAGAVGPTSKTASVSRNVDDASQRDVSFDELAAAYKEQIQGLHEGGA